MTAFFIIVSIIICLYLTFEYQVHPLLTYGIAGVLYLLIKFLGFYFKDVHEKKIKAKVNQIRQKYPNAYREFTSKKGNYIGNSPSIESLEKVAYRYNNEEEWLNEETAILKKQEDVRKERQRIEEERKKAIEHERKIDKKYSLLKKKYPIGLPNYQNYVKLSKEEIIKCEKEIKKFEEYGIKAKEYKEWVDAQNSFSDLCRTSRDQYLESFGCYSYNPIVEITDKHNKKINKELLVWQLFNTATCLDENLDYTNHPHYITQRNSINEIKNGSLVFKKRTYQIITNFIRQVSNGEKIFIYYIYDLNNWDIEILDKIYVRFLSELDKSDIEYEDFPTPYFHFEDDKTEFLSDKEEKMLLDIFEGKKVFIIDVLTSNDKLIQKCTQLFEKYKNKGVLISFISLIKLYDTNEMIEIIEKKKEDIKKEKEKEERIKRQRQKLIESVEDWNNDFGMPYTYLVNYYPTTCDFEATQEEWYDRWLIWNFKNTPGKIYQEEYDEALNKVVTRVAKKLKDIFGDDLLKQMTLVCIPASTKEKTERRYKEFYTALCEITKMESAYNYIEVIEDGTAAHTGGAGLQLNKILFSEDFFKNKNILLFDDVITHGRSMIQMRNKMKRMGAFVIGGFSIGRTKHHRQ